MAHTTSHTGLDALSSVPQAAARRPLVLVIDPDESTRSVLEVAMARDGFEVWSSATAKLGLMLLQGRLPDAIILESDLGGEDGFSFVAQLRGEERLAQIPVLLLAKADDQNVEALADVVGVDDFILKPAYARDVAALVRVELAKRQGGPLLFDSKLLPPVQLLRALMSCPRSGRLLLVDGRAEVRFRSGKVIDARFDSRGGSMDALVRALALTSGAYELVSEPIDGFAELQCGLRELVDLVMPRLQKWQRVLQRSLPLDARLTVDFGRLATGLKAMPDEVNRIVQLFDGFRSVEEVLVDSTFNETLTLEVATRLYLMGVLGPARDSKVELVEPRPMPRLFEPRATEAEELMQQLFAGTAEIRADESTMAEDQDWFSPAALGSELDLADPNGGWTTAPVPESLAAGLAPELARQLDAFQTPMRVEAQQVPPDVAAAQKFADVQPKLMVDTAMEAALLLAADARPVAEVEAELNAALNAALEPDAQAELESALLAHKAQARDRQARIETPWMTPVVEIPAPARVVDSPSTVEVAPEPVSVRESAPLLASVLAPAEAAFFDQSPSSEVVTEKAPEVAEPQLAAEPKKARRVWPYIVGGLAIVGLSLLIDGQRVAPVPAPVEETKPAAIVVAPVLPEVAPPELIEAEVVEEAPVAIDVSENLAEASKLYNAGQYRQAISVLEQVLTDDPASVTGWNLMGLAKYDALDSAGARAAAAKVLELDPANGRVQILLATLHFDANEKDLGRAALEKYLELEPNGAHVDEAKALLKR
ncbi:MAG: response regulator [Archangium sp.]|nr:response regulator [Archangium sp.]